MFRITGEIVKDSILNTKIFLKNNINNIMLIVYLVIPYLMYYIGQYVRESRGKMAIGGEIFIPIIIYLIIYYIRAYYRKVKKSFDIPAPNKRFTEKLDDGQVNVEVERVQELILYLSDLEDYLEKRGLL